MRFVLIHSPLVGPATWAPVARELSRRGHAADVPSLAAVAPIRSWRDCVDAVRDALASIREPVVLAGHSGGGVLLPAIVGAVAPPIAALIFVDSAVPRPSGETPIVPPGFLDQLSSLAKGGQLPPWAAWWGDEAMRDLVPDEGVREVITGEMPSLPLSYFEDRVPSPVGWDRVPRAYLLLSEGYRDEAEEARRRGWAVQAIEGANHLEMVVDPVAVADALVRLASLDQVVPSDRRSGSAVAEPPV